MSIRVAPTSTGFTMRGSPLHRRPGSSTSTIHGTVSKNVDSTLYSSGKSEGGRSSYLMNHARRLTGVRLLQTGLRLETGETVLSRIMPKFRNADQEKRFNAEKLFNNVAIMRLWLGLLAMGNLLLILQDTINVPGPTVVVYYRFGLYFSALAIEGVVSIVQVNAPEWLASNYSTTAFAVFFTHALCDILAHHRRAFSIWNYGFGDELSMVGSVNNSTSTFDRVNACDTSKFGTGWTNLSGERYPFWTCEDHFRSNDSALLLRLCVSIAVLSHFLGLRPVSALMACAAVLGAHLTVLVAMNIRIDAFDTAFLFLFSLVSVVGSYNNEVLLRYIFERSVIANRAFLHNRKLRASFDRHVINEQILIEEADRLERENENLRQQRRITTFRTVEMQSPLMQAITLLDNIAKDSRESGNIDLADQMVRIAQILAKSGNELTSINITAQVDDASVDLDDVTREWLNTTTTTWQKKRNTDRNNTENFNRNRHAGSPHLTLQQESGSHAQPRRTESLTQNHRSSIISQGARRVSTLKAALGLDVQSHLAALHDWNKFDVFSLAESCPNVISALMQKIIENRDLHVRLPISMSRMLNFMIHIDEHYSYNELHAPDGAVANMANARNAYHNNEHAADVLQAVECFVFNGENYDLLGPTDALALYVAAAIHDYRHIGRTNQFLIQSSHPIAIQHNDQSVLERFHLAEAFKVISRDDMNFLKRFTQSQKMAVRHTIVDLVLSTDLAQTTEYLSRFQLYLARKRSPSQDLRESSRYYSFAKTKAVQDQRSQLSAQESYADLLLLLQITIKVADIGHPCRPLALHLEWSKRIQQEFFSQGDVELECGMKVTPMCDRSITDLNKGQMGFIDFVCRPLIEPFSDFIVYPVILDNLGTNYITWQQKNKRHDDDSRKSKSALPILTQMFTIKENVGEDKRNSSVNLADVERIPSMKGVQMQLPSTDNASLDEADAQVDPKTEKNPLGFEEVTEKTDHNIIHTKTESNVTVPSVQTDTI